tara:strand:- start:1749 stop:2141 length:393 start_codon:yes stop_codon:yes gene_type:complete
MGAEISVTGGEVASHTSKVTFLLKYNNISGSSRGDGASSKIALQSSNWNQAQFKVRFTHDLGTEYVAFSINDTSGKISNDGSANRPKQYLDDGLEDDVVAVIVDSNNIDIEWDNPNAMATDDEFKVTIIG